METIKYSELKRLCFCNSKELHGKVFIIGNVAYEWTGIGMIELDIDPNSGEHITVIE